VSISAEEWIIEIRISVFLKIRRNWKK